MFLLRNEQIFSVHDRPTLAAWLAQGVGAIASAPVRARGTQLIDTVLHGAFPVGVVGMLSLVGAAPPTERSDSPTALVVLLLSGGLTFLATALLFPVATLWGTFAHASGPLLVGLIVATVLGIDALMTRISIARHWEQINVIVGPAALLALAVPIALVQLASVAGTAAPSSVGWRPCASPWTPSARSRRWPDHERPPDVPGVGPRTDRSWCCRTTRRRPSRSWPGRPASATLIMFDDRGDYPECC